jgi:hypothetical protein
VRATVRGESNQPHRRRAGIVRSHPQLRAPQAVDRPGSERDRLPERHGNLGTGKDLCGSQFMKRALSMLTSALVSAAVHFDAPLKTIATELRILPGAGEISMKNRILGLQTILFATSCYFLVFAFAWAARFAAFRILVAITVALVCLAAEAYSGYIILRQLWKWCGVGVRIFVRPESVAKPVLTYGIYSKCRKPE